MKCVLLSVRPQWVSKILNKEKIIEIRKKFPRDYVGWVYIYCTKLVPYGYGCMYDEMSKKYETTFCNSGKELPNLTGKVVARFWCDKVEEISFYQHKTFFEDGYEKEPTIVWQDYATPTFSCGLLEEPSCLSFEELHNYLRGENGYAIHITKLETFDKPKEISEFYKVGYGECVEPQGSLREQVIENYNNALKYQLTRAPQSFMFIEV